MYFEKTDLDRGKPSVVTDMWGYRRHNTKFEKNRASRFSTRLAYQFTLMQTDLKSNELPLSASSGHLSTQW